jgi:AcrR family transcriptional regulator
MVYFCHGSRSLWIGQTIRLVYTVGVPYDSAATRARLLDAAYAEFVEVGLAGARVDRIARAAAANKQGIYAYFGSKEALFDAVLESRLRVLADVAPFTPDDLPAYAGALFDQLTGDPALLRLTQWKALERPEASEHERRSHGQKAAELAVSLGIPDEQAMDVLVVTLSVVQAWSATTSSVPSVRGSDAARQRHRDFVVSTAAAIVASVR